MIDKLSQDFGDGNFPIDYIVTISRKVDEIIDYLSDKDYKFVVKAFDNFDKAQEMLQGLVNRTLEE